MAKTLTEIRQEFFDRLDKIEMDPIAKAAVVEAYFDSVSAMIDERCAYAGKVANRALENLGRKLHVEITGEVIHAS